MNESRYILFFLGILGAFNGLILGIYFLFLAPRKSLANYFLGLLLAALSIRIGKSVFVYFNHNLAKIYLQIGLSACFLIGPALYYFVRSSLDQPVKMPAAWKWILSGLAGAIIGTGVLYPYATYPWFWNDYLVWIIYAEWLLYVAATLFSIKGIARRLFTAPGRASLLPGEKWLLTIVAINVVIFLTYFLALTVRVSFPFYYSGSVIFSCCLYGIILFLLLRKQTDILFNPTAVAPKPAIKKVSDTDASMVLARLEQLMTRQEIYKNPNLTLGDLAREAEVSSHQLSAVLNDHAGKNFTSYINEYRIKKACDMIAANHPYSLEAIGYEVGFNSKSTFYTAFKKLKATTPSLYKESLLKTASL